MLPSLAYNNKGFVENPLSAYQPSSQEQELVSVGTQDIQTGDDILNRPFEEFNDHSLIERTNLDQKDWLAYSPSQSQNPDESWMFTGTSDVTRAKILSVAAHLTAQVIYPGVFAQDEDDEEDEGAAYIMKNAIEYNCRKNNYELTFLHAVISGLVNPVSYFKVEYCKAYQDVLSGTHSAYTRKKVLDEVLSGFQHNLLATEEVLLANPYIFDIQKQPFVIERKRISYAEAKARYGWHPNFAHVKPGIVPVLNAQDGLFYDASDTEEDNMVEETILKYRTRDLEFPMINRIYLGSPNVDYNPVKHRRATADGVTVPIYDIVKYGAEPIDAMRFAYYKSMANRLSNDKELVDRMRQNSVDASTFATFPSIFTMGAGKIDSSVFVPARTTEIGKDAKVQPATGFMNPEWAYKAAQQAKEDINDSSLDPRVQGMREGPETARGAVLLQQNAIRNLGVMGKMISYGLVKPVGELMVDDIIRYQTVGEAMQLAGGGLGMKYMTMILNEKIVDGAKKSIVLRFTDRWAGSELSEQGKKEMEVELFEEAGDNKEIYEINPGVFARRKFMLVVEPDAFMPKNDAFERAIKLETYDRAILNPLIAQDPEKMAEVTRDFLFEPTVKGEGSKYLPKEPKLMQQTTTPQPKSGLAGRIMEGAAVSSGVGGLTGI